jgi:hypothetical protein
MIGNTVIFSLKKNAYDYEFNYNAIGNLLNVKISCADTMVQFLFMLFLTSNGVFTLHRDIVNYVPTALPISEEPLRDKFAVSPAIARARMKFLNYCAQLVKAKKFTVLNAHTVVLSPPAVLSQYVDRISTMIAEFYDPVINGTGGTDMAKNIKYVRAMSQANKAWRASVNCNKWFVATPEFDYSVGKGINFYSGNIRNKILFPVVSKGCTKLDDADVVYDLTGIKKNTALDISRFGAIHVMWSPTLAMVNSLPDGCDYTFSGCQNHSLNLVVKPNGDAEYDKRNITKNWYLVSLRVIRSEISYMTAMMTGQFPLSGADDFEFQAANMQADDSMVDIVQMFSD